MATPPSPARAVPCSRTAPLTISRPELLIEGSDRDFRRLLLLPERVIASIKQAMALHRSLALWPGWRPVST